MTQHGAPIATAYNGDVPPWSDEVAGTVNIYRSIAELVAGDAAFVRSNVAPSVYVTRLSALTDPGDDTGHTVRVRALRVAAVATLTIELRQGYVNEGSQGTLVESFADALTAAFVTYVHPVTTAGLITNYGGLHLRFSASDLSRITWAELEAPDPATRAIVSWAVLEVPRLPAATLVVENRMMNFNVPLLLEELAAAFPPVPIPDSIVMAGFDLNADGTLIGGGFTWQPIAAERDVPPDGIAQPGDLRLYYSSDPTAAERVTIDAVLSAHVATNRTTIQQALINDLSAIQNLIDGFEGFNGLNEAQQDELLRLTMRFVLRETGYVPASESATNPTNAFAKTATVAGMNLIPSVGDPASPNDGDVWYNLTTNKFRKRENGVTSDLAGAGSFTATQVTINLPYPARTAHRATVVDAAAAPTSKIVLGLAGVPDTAVNAGDDIDMESMMAVAQAGQFQLQVAFRTPFAGPLTVNYAIG